jgi:hypothetical protein
VLWGSKPIRSSIRIEGHVFLSYTSIPGVREGEHAGCAGSPEIRRRPSSGWGRDGPSALEKVRSINTRSCLKQSLVSELDVVIVGT